MSIHKQDKLIKLGYKMSCSIPFKICKLWFGVFSWPIGIMVTVFASGLGDQGSIPD